MQCDKRRKTKFSNWLHVDKGRRNIIWPQWNRHKWIPTYIQGESAILHTTRESSTDVNNICICLLVCCKLIDASIYVYKSSWFGGKFVRGMNYSFHQNNLLLLTVIAAYKGGGGSYRDQCFRYTVFHQLIQLIAVKQLSDKYYIHTRTHPLTHTLTPTYVYLYIDILWH